MEDLFWTTLSLNGKESEYHIIFEDEQYRFIPKESSMATYRFRREHDEWQAVDAESEKVIDIAEEALEKYLFRQH
ncbi:MAG: hypothetical protein EOO10_12860 [Chitinophagaceae bacterium]|nr:MAG: hypothetical protein EOO10_12860 [Chitinophagaceae bacterium]